MRERFLAWLNDLPLTDPIERRQAPLIQLLLLALLAAALVAVPFLFIGIAANRGQSLSLVSSVLLILGFAAALVAIRRGSFRLAVALTALAFLPGQAISLFSAGTHTTGLIFLLFVIPLALVGLLGGRLALLITMGAIIAMVAVAVLLEAQGSPLVGFAPSPTTPAGTIVIFTLITLVLGFFLARYSAVARAALQDARSREQELEQLRTAQVRTITERTASLAAALDESATRAARLEQAFAEVEKQRAVVRELSVPILPVSRSTLVMPLVGALDSIRLADIQQRALDALEHSSARRLLLDITGVPLVDSQVAQGLITVVQAARLLGAEVVLIGIRPEVAQALVQLGIDLANVVTNVDLQTALHGDMGRSS
jgi:anti-anti-sigma regulatory factor